MSRYFVLFALLGILALSCNKSANSSQYVKLNECITQGTSLDLGMLCFDSVLSDSRCPPNADCFWRGMVVARFTLTTNGEQKTFDLADIHALPVVGPDTVLLGYHIHLLNVLPSPVGLHDAQHPVQAEVIFAKQ